MPPNTPIQAPSPATGPLTGAQISQIRTAAGVGPIAQGGASSLAKSLFATPAASEGASEGGLESTLFAGTDAAKTATDIAKPPAEGNLFERIGNDFSKRVDTAAQAQVDATDGKQSKGSAVLQTLGEGAGAVSDVGTESIKSILTTLNSALSHVAANPNATISPGSDLPSPLQTPLGQALLQKLQELQKAHPEATKNLGAIVNILGLIPGEGLASDALEGAVKGVAGAADIAKTAGKTGIKAATDLAGGVVEKAQLAATKGNQIPTLENAAQKGVAIPKDTSIKDPLARYDEHVATEQVALKDAKADTAMGKVGTNIGNAFDKVIAQRKAAGATMESELGKVGAHSTNTLSASDAFRSELAKNGLSYDQITKEITRGKASKVTESDQSLLQDYAKSLQALGSKPTVQELDAFLSRTPDELNVYKAKNNITGTTNGERIIKNNLTELRKELDPQIDKATGKAAKPYLKDYATARKQYANLSKFIEEGSGFLGKTTQAGDYAKDASLAKSSVQSILNNGKKDWLLKLEKLTGYSGIDDATLALQAMKDTGDYRGASLLESLTQGAAKGELPKVPTTLTGIANHYLGKGVKWGAGKFTGTPIEQTRRFLQSLKTSAPK